jgi:hypothetical protein
MHACMYVDWHVWVDSVFEGEATAATGICCLPCEGDENKDGDDE